MPSDPTLAARMLGITSEVLWEHYERAGQAQAAKTFDVLITRLQTEAIARVGYRRRGGRAEDSAGGTT